jgi:hypothetical protein
MIQIKIGFGVICVNLRASVVKLTKLHDTRSEA